MIIYTEHSEIQGFSEIQGKDNSTHCFHLIFSEDMQFCEAVLSMEQLHLKENLSPMTKGLLLFIIFVSEFPSNRR